MKAVLLAAACLLLGACAELVRWPDRMNAGGAAGATGYEPAPEGFYVVKPGDTMYSIAFRHQMDFRDLAVWNDIGPDFLIRPSQLLRLTPPIDSGDGIQTRPLDTAMKSESPVRLPPPDRPRPSPPPPPREPDEPVVMKGGWQWPAPGPVLKRFGQDGSKGLDIGGEVGQPVLAAAPGKVVYSGSALKGYGELIIVKHDDLRLSAYGYNRRRLVEEGATVAAGQTIAELGVGPEQKPLLHFEIRERGKPVDPGRLLPSR